MYVSWGCFNLNFVVSSDAANISDDDYGLNLLEPKKLSFEDEMASKGTQSDPLKEDGFLLYYLWVHVN